VSHPDLLYTCTLAGKRPLMAPQSPCRQPTSTDSNCHEDKVMPCPRPPAHEPHLSIGIPLCF